MSPRVIPRDLLRELVIPSDSRIVLFVIDGLGGMPRQESGLTELETARTPHLDRLAERSICGLSEPVGAGIAPGSGPGHLALFGYDPIENLVGRGILSALGVGFPLEPGDVAARINFATVDKDGNIVDRRAGRIGTDVNRRLVTKLRSLKVPGLDVFLETESEHRAVAIFRGDGLSDALDDTDPQRIGVPAPAIAARRNDAEATAAILNRWVVQARATLAEEHPANMVLLRGFAQRPDLGTFQTRYELASAAIAVYPMYRGLARLVGMDILETGKTLDEQLDTLEANWPRHTFFYVHLKAADAAGEDGDFDRRVRIFEDVDSRIDRLLALKPDCLVITGDHSTPALLKQHSWHPVPFLLHSPNEIADRCESFGERACAGGSLGTFPAQAAMQLMLAASLKLTKYGA